jgi:hypothetical protein
MKRAVVFTTVLAWAAGAGARHLGAGLETPLYGLSGATLGGGIPPSPVNGFLSFGLDVGEGCQAVASAGAGSAETASLVDPSFAGTAQSSRTTARSARVELEARASRPLVILSAIRAYAGLGFGYYGTDIDGETRVAGRILRSESEIRGPAQFFCLGPEYRMGSRGGALLQFKKLGWSGIRMDGREHSAPEGETRYENDLAPGPGLEDVSVGLAVTLRFGRERSAGGIRIE